MALHATEGLSSLPVYFFASIFVAALVRRSHSWSFSAAGVGAFVTTSGVRVNNYIVNPETQFTATDLVSIGVLVHELGHALGLPDLYDTAGTGEGTFFFSFFFEMRGVFFVPCACLRRVEWCERLSGWRGLPFSPLPFSFLGFAFRCIRGFYLLASACMRVFRSRRVLAHGFWLMGWWRALGRALPIPPRLLEQDSIGYGILFSFAFLCGERELTCSGAAGGWKPETFSRSTTIFMRAPLLQCHVFFTLGYLPLNLCSLCACAGWMTPQVISLNGVYTLRQVESNAQCLRVSQIPASSVRSILSAMHMTSKGKMVGDMKGQGR